MKLNTNELKKFKAIASTIKQNNILPILGYLKFENRSVTKSNMESFVTMEIDFNGESFLVDEKILMSFIEGRSEKEVDIEVGEKSVTITMGKAKMKSPTDEVKNFPVIVDAIGDTFDFDSELLDKIKTASLFTGEHENMPFTLCVFLGNEVVAASTGFVAYVQPIGKEYPQIILEKNTLAALRSFSSITFSQNETYQFYTTDIYKFGFVKKDTPFTNMKPFGVIPEGLKKVELDKNEIIRFCDSVVNSCSGRPVVANIKGNKLIMIDSAYEINCEESISETLEDFTFNPALMSKLLKSLPDEKVNFIKAKGKYYVTGTNDYVSLIMEMAGS